MGKMLKMQCFGRQLAVYDILVQLLASLSSKDSLLSGV